MPSHSRKSNRARMQTSDELEGTHDGGVSLESYENRRYTVTEIGEARDFFSQLNPKKTPYITKSDFHRQMHKVVPNASVETRELMRHVLDKDDNNRIDEAEFMASWGFMQDTLKALDGIDDDNKYEESSANLSDEKIEELRLVYEAIDKDGNGVLSSDEFKDSMHKILGYAKEQTNAMLTMLDMDGDNMVTFEEFVKAQTFFTTGEAPRKPVDETVEKKRSLTAAQMREAKAVYKSFDANNDGCLETAELASRMSDFGWSDAEVTKTVGDMDTDKDGKVSEIEFMASYLDFIQFDDELVES